ncbi:BsuBI/PstI family type II restriction endonuclease [Empedobacter brevis]
MNKIDEAQFILDSLGFDTKQKNKIATLTLLALANIKKNDKWVSASNPRLGVAKGIMTFISKEYNITYKENTRESVRRQVLHYFIQKGLIEQNPDDKTIPVNSSRNNYALTEEFLNVIKTYGSTEWDKTLKAFLKETKDIVERYETAKSFDLVPVKISDDKTINLSAGLHNDLQKAIIEEFAPRFAPNSELLYLGDTANKNIHIEEEKLKELGIPITKHSKLPDVILFRKEKNWVYLIEAVTTHGPVSQKRINELEELFKDCNAGKVYVTAFPDMSVFKKYSTDIAWETEVWLMDLPDHMIHFNGDRFMGPR